ncbi:MAG: CvpA family protein [Candidatus Eremiobacteraeota bacterium]|nr:CvpA family protein [Candidatus Eremiobacteraeota bacterium]
MTSGAPWADVLIGGALALTTFVGFKRGFIREIGALIAVVALIVAPHYYNGAADGLIDSYTKLGLVGSHVVGMLLTGIIAYVVIIVATMALSKVAKLPIIGLGNAIAGAVVGFIKAALAIWLVLYVALFFPLTPQVRATLHDSKLAPFFVTFDPAIDAVVEAAIPGFIRPLTDPYFERHHL